MQGNIQPSPILPDLIQAFGKPAHTAWLDPKYNIFYYTLPPAPDIEGSNTYSSPSATPSLAQQGAVGYVIHTKCAVVFGEPLCSISVNNFLQMELTNAFIIHCDKLKLKPVFMACSEDFKNMLAQHNWVSICAMKEEIIKTTDNKTSSNIKKSVKRANQAGVEIHEYHPSCPLIPGFDGYDHQYFQNEVMALAKVWQGERKGWQMYSNQVTPFASRARWFYAVVPAHSVTMQPSFMQPSFTQPLAQPLTQPLAQPLVQSLPPITQPTVQSSLVQPPMLAGILTLARLSARNGYFVEYNLCHPNAPAGTTEALMQEVITTFKEENQSLSYGMAPVTQLQINNTMGHFKASLAEKAYSKIYGAGDLDGKQKFCRKFGIADELNMYVCARRKDMGTRVLVALFKSLNINYSDGQQTHTSHTTTHSIVNIIKTHKPFSKHRNHQSTNHTSPPTSAPTSPTNYHVPVQPFPPIVDPQTQQLSYNSQSQYIPQVQPYSPNIQGQQMSSATQYAPQIQQNIPLTQQYNPQMQQTQPTLQYNSQIPYQQTPMLYQPQQAPQAYPQPFPSEMQSLNQQMQQTQISPQQPLTLQNQTASSQQPILQNQNQPIPLQTQARNQIPHQVNTVIPLPTSQPLNSVSPIPPSQTRPPKQKNQQNAQKQQKQNTSLAPTDPNASLSKNKQKQLARKQQKLEKKQVYKQQAMLAKQGEQTNQVLSEPAQNSELSQTPQQSQMTGQMAKPQMQKRSSAAQLQLQMELQNQLEQNFCLRRDSLLSPTSSDSSSSFSSPPESYPSPSPSPSNLATPSSMPMSNPAVVGQEKAIPQQSLQSLAPPPPVIHAAM